MFLVVFLLLQFFGWFKVLSLFFAYQDVVLTRREKKALVVRNELSFEKNTMMLT